MNLCTACAGIHFGDDDSQAYVLQNSSLMKVSAEEGCPGCEFFLQAARNHLGVHWTKEAIANARLYVELKRVAKGDNRVDLRFCLGDGQSLEARGTAPLRLCSAYGERASSHTVAVFCC